MIRLQKFGTLLPPPLRLQTRSHTRPHAQLMLRCSSCTDRQCSQTCSYTPVRPRLPCLLLGLLLLFTTATATAQPAQQPSPSAAALQLSLNAAVAAASPRFTIPPGAFHFHATPFTVAHASNLVIDASPDTELWFSVGGGVVREEKRREEGEREEERSERR